MAILLGTAQASITLDISSFMANARTAESAMNQLAAAGGNSQPTFFDGMKSSALGLGTALVAPMVLGLNAAVDLEQAIANVDAALGDVDDSTLVGLADAFNEIAIASQFSATEVAGVAEGLAKAGFDASELENVTQAVVLLSQATGDGLAPAMDSVIAAMSIWSEETVGVENALTDATRVADIMTTAANQSTASISDINAGMRSLGPVAASMGVGFDEAAAAIALFTNYGLRGADAGVSLARGLQNLADPTSEAAAKMDELGIAAFDLEGNFIGFPALFDQLNTAMAGMSDEAQLMALSTIFGAEAMDVMGLAILSGADPLEAMIALMGESGTAAEQSAIRMDTLGAAFGTLKEGITTFLGSLVSGLIPGLRFFVDTANLVVDALMKIPGPIKTIIGAVAGLLALFASISIGVGAFSALTGVMGALGIGAGIAGLSLGGVLAVIAGLTLAVGGLYVAWNRNFLGMRTGFERVVNGIKRFGKSFLDTFRNLTTATYQWGDTVEDIVPTMDKFPAFFIALGNAIGTIGGGLPILGDFGRLIVDLGFDLAQFSDVFTRLTDEGFNPFVAGLTAATSAFPALIGPVRTILPIIESLTAAFQDFTAGDFEAGLVNIGEAAAAAFSALADFGGRILDWTLDVAVPTITGWIVDVAGDVWGAITAAAGFVWDGLVDLGAWSLNVATPTMLGWLSSAAGDIWTAIKATAGFIWGGVQDLGAWTLSVPVPNIAGWVVTDLWPAIQTAAGWVWDGVESLGAWTLEVAAPNVIGWVADAANNIWEALLAASNQSGPPKAVMADWTLQVAAPTASGWIDNIGEWFAQTIDLADFSAASAVVGEKVGDAIAQAIGSFASFDFGQAFVDLATAAMGGLATAIENLDGAAIGQAIGTVIGFGVTAAIGVPIAFTAFTAKMIFDLAKALTDPGNISDLGAAIADVASSAVDFARGLLPGLWDGFWDGMATALNAVGADVEASFIGIVNGVIRAINVAIDGLNQLPGVSIGHIDLIPTDADQAAQDLIDWGVNAARTATAEFRRVFAEGMGSGAPIPSGGSDSGGGGGGGGGGGWELDVSAITNQIANMKRLIAPEITNLFSDVGPAIETAFSGAQSSVSAGMATLTATMANGAATATTAFSTLFATVAASVQTGMAGAASAVSASMGQIVAAMANGGALATAALTNTLAPIPAMVQSVGVRAGASATLGGLLIAQGFQRGAATAPALVAAALAAVPGVVSSVGGRAAAAAFAVGANIGNAMAAGMRSALGQIQAAASAMVAAAQTALAAAAMISSPSKLFMQMGEYVGEGFTLGIRSQIPSAALAAADLVSVPNVVPGQYARSAAAGGAYAGGGATYVIDARTIVQGDVTHENDLTARILTKGWEAERAEAIRHRVAAGVTP